MKFLNIAGYKFLILTDLENLRVQILAETTHLGLKGTILISEEGINISLAGFPEKIKLFINFLKQDTRFADIVFKESYSDFQPFKILKVKYKKEIITLKRDDIHPEEKIAPEITPEEFKKWLDENRDITVLDTRNEYEVRFGTFKQAQHLNIQDFSEFPKVSKKISRDKPIVMFCTGGIRCEKAAWVMLKEGYSEVYQLKGGILNYFATVGGEHWQDECFVFDQRVALNSKLEVSGTQQCEICEGPIRKNEHHCAI